MAKRQPLGVCCRNGQTRRAGGREFHAVALSRQRRKGKPVPYISHLIAVSGLVWEDGGTSNQAIAGRFGELGHKPIASLLVTAADKAHNARDMALDARRDAGMWSKFNAGFCMTPAVWAAEWLCSSLRCSHRAEKGTNKPQRS